MQNQLNSMMMQAAAANAQRAASADSANKAKAAANANAGSSSSKSTTISGEKRDGPGVQRVAVMGAQTHSSPILAEHFADFDEFDNAMF